MAETVKQKSLRDYRPCIVTRSITLLLQLLKTAWETMELQVCRPASLTTRVLKWFNHFWVRFNQPPHFHSSLALNGVIWRVVESIWDDLDFCLEQFVS